MHYVEFRNFPNCLYLVHAIYILSVVFGWVNKLSRDHTTGLAVISAYHLYVCICMHIFKCVHTCRQSLCIKRHLETSDSRICQLKEQNTRVCIPIVQQEGMTLFNNKPKSFVHLANSWTTRWFDIPVQLWFVNLTRHELIGVDKAISVHNYLAHVVHEKSNILTTGT